MTSTNVSFPRLNIEAVNEAYNDLPVEEEDYKTSRNSIDSFDNINNIQLAKRLEMHELLEFRKLAVRLYKVSSSLLHAAYSEACRLQKNNKQEESTSLSKQDKLFKDAV